MPYQSVTGFEIFYEDIGVGPPLLFLHSHYSRSLLAFSGQIQPFSHKYRCLYPDFPGHGRTRGGKEWNTPRAADTMAEFLAALGIDRAFLLGYSMGGGVALHLAAAHPGLAQAVITIGTGGVPDPQGADDYEPEALLTRGETATIERMRALHLDAHGGDWQTYARQTAADWRNYPRLTDAEWSRLTMPMLLIGGENDSFASPEKLTAMKARCPQAEIWSVPGAGHRPHMPMEQVRSVNERMLAFLQGVQES